MRTQTPSASPTARRARRARRVVLATGTIVAAWMATGAPIHLGMIEDIVNGIAP